MKQEILLKISGFFNNKISIKQFIQLKILWHNSSNYSINEHRPFGIILGKTNALESFDVTDENIFNIYMNDRKERFNELYKTIHDKNLKDKINIMNARNEA